ncbi:MAG: hypothetical protein ACKOEQ_12535, partial [Verrucomicrobiota bacterium]
MKILSTVAGLVGMACMLAAQTNVGVTWWPAGQVPGARGEGTNDVPTLTVCLLEPGRGEGSAMVM